MLGDAELEVRARSRSPKASGSGRHASTRDGDTGEDGPVGTREDVGLDALPSKSALQVETSRDAVVALPLPQEREQLRLPFLEELFIAADAGDAATLRRALGRGGDPNFIALASCVCKLAEDACVCLGYTPLHCATQTGSACAVRALLTGSADPNARSGRVRFRMHHFASGFIESGDGCPERRDGMIVVDGVTALHVAVACGHVEIAKLLLDRNADPHLAAVEPRKTALGFAVASQAAVGLTNMLRRASAEQVSAAASAPLQEGVAETFLSRQDGVLSERIAAVRQRVLARQRARIAGGEGV
eukprot:TRINITY_DN34478_c0_g1_i1.p1 TRINITY_DN34478_c0_g1~~TRINITY_DN34478_c0_g1_i1.p1  ORF type:complete len:330 (+),score=46.79 TRINITY_DN34478_c0_g1_i1:85-990(+)